MELDKFLRDVWVHHKKFVDLPLYPVIVNSVGCEKVVFVIVIIVFFRADG